MQVYICPETEKCLEIIHLVFDCEASEEQEKYLKEHLDICVQCLDNYNIEKEVREALKVKISGLKAPQDLIKEVKNIIGQEN